MNKLLKLPRFGMELLRHHYQRIVRGNVTVSAKNREAWKSKWEKPSILKVLMVAPKDYAGSFYGWTKAVNRFSPDVACRQISFFSHRYHYDYDCIFHAFDKPLAETPNIKALVDEADILHLKDEFYFYNHNHRPSISKGMLALIDSFRKKNKPIIFTHYGSFARRFSNEDTYQRAVLEFDHRIALTPDLNFDWFKGSFIPHAVDLDHFPMTWSESKIFSHSPSSRDLKGSEQMLQALKMIEPIQQDWKINIIENMSYSDCLRQKSHAELFFDQAGKDPSAGTIGWYGNSAVEAMAFGIPTIAHLSEIALERAKNAGKDIRNICPVLNTGTDVDSMRETVLKYVGMPSDEKKYLANTTRKWAENFHGEATIAKELSVVYEKNV